MQASFSTAVYDERALRAALQEADIVPTLLVLVQLTGDMEILHEAAPFIKGAWNFQEEIPEQLKEKIRDRLVETLKSHTGVRPNLTPPDEDILRQMMSVAVGQTVPSAYVPLLLEEMGLSERHSRTTATGGEARRPPKGFKVAVIGAGLAGICAAIQLEQAGIPFVILEKNADIGGTWFENSYPGCGVDTPNHYFSYSFSPNNDWPHHFSKQGEILSYIRKTAEKFKLRDRIRLGVEVTRASFDEAVNRWNIETVDGQGRVERLRATALISAVGQLNRPFIPRIEGLEFFKGAKFHTARWDHSFEVNGKRVALVGTGASGMQVGPSIAPDVAELLVFQRAPNWAMRNPNYHKAVTDGHRWALNHIPFFSQWQRFQLFWVSAESFHDTLRVDPKWPMSEISLNRENHAVREQLVAYIRSELGGDESLIAKCTPNYPPYGSRMLRDNNWYRMLKLDNVELITDAISHVTENAIVMEDGTRHQVDAIVFATGFQASRMLWPMEIRGRHGVDLRQLWGDDDPRAYKGMTVPQFPNFFVMYGPNTNPGPGGSTIFYFECQIRYIMQALRAMIDGNLATIEVKQEVHDQYNAVVDERCANMVWSHPRVTSWYKNAAGRVTVNSPWKQLEYWQITQRFEPSEYLCVPRSEVKTSATEFVMDDVE
jgi:4-hydroxyacetophenone monooxygenase